MKASFLSCLLVVFVLAFPCLLDAQEGEGAPSEELWWTPYVEHLRSFGYETQITEGAILAFFDPGHNDPGHNLRLEHSELGVLVTAFFSNDSGKAYDADLYETVNTVNSQAILSRTYVGKNETILIEGFYTAEYDRTRFPGFLNTFRSEMTQVLVAWSEWADSEPAIE